MQATTSRSVQGLLPYEITEIVDQELSQPKFLRHCTAVYIAAVRNFIQYHGIQPLADAHRSRRMFEALEHNNEWDMTTNLSMSASGNRSHFRIMSIAMLK